MYEGDSETDPKVGKWCGNRIPPEYSSLTNKVLLVFRTDWSSQYAGFRVSYEVLCGGKFEDDNGILTSPYYPRPYQTNQKCEYYIDAPMGKAIELEFSDFDIEDSGYDSCDFDSLSIYDGTDSNATLLGTYCGRNTPPTAISTYNAMFLIFRTDVSISGRGFKANYSFSDVGKFSKVTVATFRPLSESFVFNE